ncbi:MAG: terminase [Rhodospirillaceae bacterium]|nr:terminase [Rhodospirillaceae bacterium]
MDDVAELRRLEADLAELERRRERSRLFRYRPYSKQMEFHALGAVHRERLLLGGNRVGKTECGGAEFSFHATGRYPDWWRGRRFDQPINAWAAGITSESTRDVIQAKLLGPPAHRPSWGTGLLPGDDIVSWSLSRGVPDAVDSIVVKHVSGGHSLIGFKSYERGREKFQGARLHVGWADEEPAADVYAELLARIGDTGGICFLTMTPLLGMSEVVRSYIQPEEVQPAAGGPPDLVKPPHWQPVDDADETLTFKVKPPEPVYHRQTGYSI